MISFDPNVGGYLTKAFSQGFGAHAYIVVGEKNYLPTLLKECAVATLCPSHTFDNCEICNKIHQNIHQDVISLPKDSQKGRLKVEDISFLVEESSLRPVEGSSVARVFLIDASNSVAGVGCELWQNKLLKTIEEPTNGVYVFIGVTDAESLLPTVRSRCQVLKQTMLSHSQVCEELCKKGYNLSSCQIVASVANGSVQMAERLLADANVFESFNTAKDILCSMSSTKVALPYVSQILNNRNYVLQTLSFLTILLRESIVYRLSPQLCLLSTHKFTIDTICENYTIHAGRVCIEKINDAKYSLDQGCNMAVVVDTLIAGILEVKYRCRL